MHPDSLAESVLESNLCIGCGVCAHLSPGDVSLRLNTDGFYQASIRQSGEGVPGQHSLVYHCPMSGVGPDEDELAKGLFDPSLKSHPRIGRYLSCYAARVNDPVIYNISSSGGIGRWLLAKMLDRGIIDSAAIVLPRQATTDDPTLFRYGIATTPKEVLEAATSAYYPVEMSAILDHIRATPGRYAVTALPCFSKALRTLCDRDHVMRERIAVVIGAVCGHLKSTFYAELLGWQLGVQPNDLGGINFRVKIPGCKANEKGVLAYARSDPKPAHGPVRVQDLYGTNYGAGFFKYKACDYCDDVVAETADVSVGDAWLPEYLEAGTSLVIVRQPWINDLLEAGREAGELKLESLTAEAAAVSQAAGLRHRREGLAYRLELADQAGMWRPRKRVAPSSNCLTPREQSIHRYRMKIAEASTREFSIVRRSGSFQDFRRRMAPLLACYKTHYGSPLARLLKQLAVFFGVHF
jgi:coenzyme F420 hydrogenase subunit beta